MKLVAAAVAAFPSYHDRDMVPTADLWLELLGHLPFEVAKAAMIKVLATAQYFPTPAQILAAVATIQPQDLPDPEMAWQEVLDQIRRVGYLGQPAWSHPAVGQAANALYGGWAQLCQSLMVETLGVDRAHFMRLFEAFTKKEREGLTLPPEVRRLTEKLTRAIKAGEGVDQA